ncbi:MAG TPA: hypothetical protein VKG01_00715 [Thermoanaerobaculia bacterium]|nr:hypothetical protein [Thermoanaerobaculia bacterium]
MTTGATQLSDRSGAVRRRADDWIAAGIGSLLLLYAILRAAMLPVLFDEAFTYLSFVREPLTTLLNPLGSERGIDANNHILNTLLVKLCVALFGTSEFVFRIPNLVALASYLLFAWMFLRRYSRTLPPLAGFVLIGTNPFLLDLFSAARGYGLSIGLLLPALYLLAVASEQETPARERELLAFLLLSAAVLSSYLLVNVYAATLLVWFAMVATRAAGRRGPGARPGEVILDTLRGAAPVLLISAALLAATVPVLLALHRAGGFYWGGQTGFWRDTVGSLVVSTLYRAPYTATMAPLLLGVTGVSILAIATISCARPLWRRDTRTIRVLAGISAITGLSSVLVLLEHSVLGAKFPIDRMGSFLVPLFLISLWLAIESASSAGGGILRYAARAGVIALGAAGLVHLIWVGSLRVSYLWQYDLDTPTMLADLTRLRGQDTGQPERTRLGISPFLMPGIDYYRVVRDLSWLAPMNQLGPWGNYDFIYIMPMQEPEARLRGYRVLRRYPQTSNTLWLPPSRPASSQGDQRR